MAALLRSAVFFFSLVALSSCATTKPWEREALARPEMAPDEDAERGTLRGHYRAIREGAVGGFSGAGGGCGCN